MTTPAAPNAAQGGAPASPALGTAEYDAAMAAKGAALDIRAISADGSQVTPVGATPTATPPSDPATPPATPPADRPSWLPEKFASVEDMAKAYSALEAKLGGNKPADPPATPPNTPEAAQNAPQGDKPLVDVSKFQTEFETNGGLSDESYAELAKAGFDKGVVDTYIAGQMAARDAFLNAGYEVVGGKESYDAMVQWAASNLPKDQAVAFNKQVSSGDKATMQMAITALNAKYVAANGKTPALLSGGAPSTNTTSGYASRAEVTRDMADARYKTDPAFRQTVMNKLAATPDSII